MTRKKQMNFIEILNLGLSIEKELKILDNTEHNELVLYVQPDLFKKLDEDIYYRQFPDGDSFIPSDDTIIVNLEHLVILIKKKKE